MSNQLTSASEVRSGNPAPATPTHGNHDVRSPRLSVNQITTLRWGFEEDVENYSAAGISAMGVWLRKLSDFGEERGIDLLRESGMSVSSVSHAGGFTGANGYSYLEAVSEGRKAIDLCVALNAGCLVILGGARRTHTHRHAARLVREGLEALGEYAGEREITLAVQPVHSRFSHHWTFLNTLDQTLKMLDHVGLPNVQLALDLFHLQGEPALIERLPELVERIGIVQISDSDGLPESEYNRLFPGDGQIPIQASMDVLEASGYRGMFDIQIWSQDVWSSDYHQLLNRCRAEFTSLCPA